MQWIWIEKCAVKPNGVHIHQLRRSCDKGMDVCIHLACVYRIKPLGFRSAHKKVMSNETYRILFAGFSQALVLENNQALVTRSWQWLARSLSPQITTPTQNDSGIAVKSIEEWLLLARV